MPGKLGWPTGFVLAVRPRPGRHRPGTARPGADRQDRRDRVRDLGRGLRAWRLARNRRPSRRDLAGAGHRRAAAVPRAGARRLGAAPAWPRAGSCRGQPAGSNASTSNSSGMTDLAAGWRTSAVYHTTSAPSRTSAAPGRRRPVPRVARQRHRARPPTLRRAGCRFPRMLVTRPGRSGWTRGSRPPRSRSSRRATPPVSGRAQCVIAFIAQGLR